LVALLSVALYGFTDKYGAWVAAGDPAYLGSRYAYIAGTVALCALATLIYRSFDRPPIARVFLVSLFALTFVGSLSASYLNHRVASTMRLNYAKWQAFRTAVGCDALYSMLADREVAGPRLWSHVWHAHPRRDDYWLQYALRSFGKSVNVVRQDRQTDAAFDYRSSPEGQLRAVLAGVTDHRGELTQLRILAVADRTLPQLLEEFDVGSGMSQTQGTARSECGSFVLHALQSSAGDGSMAKDVPPNGQRQAR
jgi:hypothetical protein